MAARLTGALCAAFLLAPALPAHAGVRVVHERDGTLRFTNRPPGQRPAARVVHDPDGALRLVLRGGVQCSPRPDNGQYDAYFARAADETGVDVALLKAVARTESGFDPRAVSVDGAQGIMQLMPDTAHRLGVGDPFDPAQSILGGARYLAELLAHYDGNLLRAVAAYNAGPDAVDRYGGVPPYGETQTYVRHVLDRYGVALVLAESSTT